MTDDEYKQIASLEDRELYDLVAETGSSQRKSVAIYMLEQRRNAALVANSPSTMWKYSVLCAYVVGALPWFFTLIFLKSNPLGNTDFMSICLLFSPMVGLATLVVRRELTPARRAALAWIIALGPILAVPNVLLLVSAPILRGVGPEAMGTWNPYLIALMGIWFIPTVLLHAGSLLKTKASDTKPLP